MDPLAEKLIMAPGLLFALTVHEYAHGWVANKLGDPTAKAAGRLTFNPIVHLDFLGTLMFFIVKLGWAKPVPVNPYNLRNPREDIMWVNFAGPASNFLTAFVFAVVYKLVMGIFPYGIPKGSFIEVIILMVLYCIYLNIVLGIFNLIPIPPLDGSKILIGFLPSAYAFPLAQLERFGPFPLIFILMISYAMNLNIFWVLIRPFVSLFSAILGIRFI